MDPTARRRAFLAGAALLCLAGGSSASGQAGSGAEAPPPAAAIGARLAAGQTTAGEHFQALESLRPFYAGRGLRAAWLDAGRLSVQAEHLVAALRGAGREGLRPADYHLDAIDRELATLRCTPTRTELPFPELETDLDLLLSDAFFLYASHLTRGRVPPQSVEPDWNIPGRARDLVFLLTAALEGRHLDRTLADLPPSRDDYRRLREALPGFRAVAEAGGWPLVPWGRALRAGDHGPRVAALRRRLAATGELPAGAASSGEAFDAALAQALRVFQARHGIEPDGVAGKRTLSELNAPARRRADQIVANLERLRWLPRELGPRHLLVNVADYRLVVTEGGAPVDTMKVIAGREARRTPFFTGEITSILLNPTWTVPEKIAVEDKLPAILEDPGYLAEQGFRVFGHASGRWKEVDPATVDWTRLSKDHFPYQLRQDAGPRNALGRIKFQVPNRNDVYLHDTPSRDLFAKAERSFSSGCIRVERALDLAQRLLASDPAWPRERIERTIAGGETVSIPLRDPMPVYILSRTAWVGDDGALQFREDLYGRDAAVLEGLASPLATQ